MPKRGKRRGGRGKGYTVEDYNKIPALISAMPLASREVARQASRDIKKKAEEMWRADGQLAPSIPPPLWENAEETIRTKKRKGSPMPTKPLFEFGHMISKGLTTPDPVKVKDGWIAALSFRNQNHPTAKITYRQLGAILERKFAWLAKTADYAANDVLNGMAFKMSQFFDEFQ